MPPSGESVDKWQRVNWRYAWFDELRVNEGLISATAHQLNDHLEPCYKISVRGTGLADFWVSRKD